MKKVIIYLFLIILTGLCQSCQGYSDGRMLKKFISRFNAEEYPSAAAYVYPGDRMNVAFFAKEVKKLAPHAFIKLKDFETEKIGENRYIKADLKWENTTPALMSYFKNIGHPLNSDGTQTINLDVRDTNDGETLSFPWGVPNVLSDNLWIASIETKDDKPAEKIKIHLEPNIKSKEVGIMDHSLIVEQENENGWIPVYQVDRNGMLQKGYIHKNASVSLDRTAYFSLGIFDSMSLIVALAIIIVIIFPLYYLGSFMSSLFTNLPIVGPIVCIVLILAVLYVVYQLLEKILFELFIINLPY